MLLAPALPADCLRTPQYQHGKAHRPGLFQCNDCREQFTVTVNTVCERSKIPPTKWCTAIYLLNSSKKGMSALQMHRMTTDWYKPCTGLSAISCSTSKKRARNI